MAATWPISALAQQPAKLRRVGVLMGIGDDAEGTARLAALTEGLKSSGRAIGKNIELDIRWGAADQTLTDKMAREILDARPDVILAGNTSSVSALLKYQSAIPIVFASVFDPIDANFVTNLARPGGRLTGFTNHESSMGGKWLQILKEIEPKLSDVRLMYNPRTAPYTSSFFSQAFAPEAASQGIKVSLAAVSNTEEITRIIGGLAGVDSAGIIAMADPFTAVHRRLIAELTLRHRVRSGYPWSYFVTVGGLFSYGPDLIDVFRRSAGYIDRILEGEQPGNLPVQAPTKFQFVINLKTASALGLTVPAALLARADEVIE